MRQRIKKGERSDIKEVSEDNDNVVPANNESSQSRWWLFAFLTKCLTILKYSIVILVIPPLLNYAALLREAAVLMPQGALYDVGFGQKMFMSCNGSGLPTVILDAPTGMSSDAWTLIFEEISMTTKVCMYDRAGLGFSERPYQASQNETQDDQKKKRSRWQPYTVERMVDDLHRLITYSSQQPRPFILVGAEMGALVARFFTQIYEGDVTDVVLIEPLPEDLFSYESNVWLNYWSEHLVSRYQSMQLSAAVGLTRIGLMFGANNFPMSDAISRLPSEVVNRQKHLLCSPRHISSVVDEHYFINETFSQMQTVFRMKAFPGNVSVTIINGNQFDEQLPNSLNKAWDQAQQNLASKLHANSKKIVVKSTGQKMLYHEPNSIVSEIKRLVHHWRAKQPKSA